MNTAQTLVRTVANTFSGTVIRLLVGALSLGTTTLWAQEAPRRAPTVSIAPSAPETAAVAASLRAPTIAPLAERLLPAAAEPAYSVASRGFFRRRGPRGARMGGGGNGGVAQTDAPDAPDLTAIAAHAGPVRRVLTPATRLVRGVLAVVRLPLPQGNAAAGYGRPMLVYSKPAARTSAGR